MIQHDLRIDAVCSSDLFLTHLMSRPRRGDSLSWPAISLEMSPLYPRLLEYCCL